MIRSILSLVGLLAMSAPLAAQAMLSGRLVEQSSGRPMYCWQVRLLDSAGVARDSTVTWRNGLFEFTVPTPSSFQLEVKDSTLTNVRTALERADTSAFLSREYRIALYPDPAVFSLAVVGDPTSPIGPEPNSPGPLYPEELRRAGIEGVVHYTFAIDTLGRIDTASALRLRSTHREFGRAVERALPYMRFRRWTPAEGQFCTRVIQPFVFNLAR